MSNKINVSNIVNEVAKVLVSNPTMLDNFKGAPHQTVEEISGVDGISAGDMSTILSTLLAGSNEGKGLLGDVIGTLLSGKKNKAGQPNIVGELIKQVVGTNQSNDIITLLVTALITNALNNTSDNKKKTTTTKKTTTKKDTTKKDTTKKATTKTDTKKATTTKKDSASKASTKATPKKTTTKKDSGTTKKSSKKDSNPDLLSTIVDVLGNSDIDVSDIIGKLLSGNKKK